RTALGTAAHQCVRLFYCLDQTALLQATQWLRGSRPARQQIAVCTGCATSANGCVQRFLQRRALQPAQCVRGGGQGAPAAAGGASCRLCAAQSRGQGAGENISQRVVVITSRPAAQPEHAVIQQRRVIQAAVDD